MSLLPGTYDLHTKITDFNRSHIYDNLHQAMRFDVMTGRALRDRRTGHGSPEVDDQLKVSGEAPIDEALRSGVVTLQLTVDLMAANSADSRSTCSNAALASTPICTWVSVVSALGTKPLATSPRYA